jgi:hypothetical protein
VARGGLLDRTHKRQPYVSAAHPTRHARSRGSRGSLAAGSRRYSCVEWPLRAGSPLDDLHCATAR